MESDHVSDILAQIRRRDRRYRTNAYLLVLQLIDYAQAKRYSERELRNERCSCHVTPQQLVEDMQEFALGQFGLLGHFALETLGIHTQADLAEILRNLIQFKLLSLGPDEGLYTMCVHEDWTALKNAYIKEVADSGVVYSLGS